MQINFTEYKKWVDEQVCCDCGKPTREATPENPFVTETQCVSCWKKFGTPEKRNMKSARELFENRHAI